MNRVEHLLSCLAEECAEVAQRAHKAQRFGVSEIQPGQALTNEDRLVEELNDLFAVAELLELDKHPWYRNPVLIDMKKSKVAEYMEYARSQGALTKGG